MSEYGALVKWLEAKPPALPDHRLYGWRAVTPEGEDVTFRLVFEGYWPERHEPRVRAYLRAIIRAERAERAA